MQSADVSSCSATACLDFESISLRIGLQAIIFTLGKSVFTCHAVESVTPCMAMEERASIRTDEAVSNATKPESSSLLGIAC